MHLAYHSFIASAAALAALTAGAAYGEQIEVKVPQSGAYTFYPIEVENVTALKVHLAAHCVREQVRIGVSVQGSDDKYVSEAKAADALDENDFQTLTDSGQGYSHFLEARDYRSKDEC